MLFLARINSEPPMFEIVAGYQHRVKVASFDDTSNDDSYQDEVYRYALGIAQQNGVNKVFDFGCGSAFKLRKYFSNFECVGFEVGHTLEYLRSTYPDSEWRNAISWLPDEAADLVICSDVIEHVADPIDLLRLLQKIAKRDIIISTPARNLLYWPGEKERIGPPRNSCHFREWTFSEFHNLLSKEFFIQKHLISNKRQATQMAHCLVKKGTTTSTPLEAPGAQIND